MLQRLLISNYAIIDKLELHFPAGLNIITGETGAGKSILMGALNLLLGERADSNVLLDESKKCITEATFKIANNSSISEFLKKYELDEPGDVIIRREIAASGKSRAFINDTPVTLVQVRELSVMLADLHQQFDTLELSDKKYQFSIIDSYAGNAQNLVYLKQSYDHYAALSARLSALEKDQAEALKEKDYLQFQFDALESASFKPNELEDLDEELLVLSNAEDIKKILSEVTDVLQEGEDPLTSKLKVITQQLGHVNALPSIAILSERLSAAAIEIRDVSDSLKLLEQKVNIDPQRVEEINLRIAEGYTLLKKHTLHTTADLLSLQARLAERLTGFTDTATIIDQIKGELVVIEKKCIEIATKIHKKRMEVKDVFAAEVNGLLKNIGMPGAALQIQIEERKLSETGIDEILFLFDANARGKFEILHKVASGGELSRLMLCIKSLVAGKMELPTLIFDEIDTGISGEAARQVGNIMKQMSARHQMIVISHQPQVAAKADTHLYVYKEDAGLGIQTKIAVLTVDERIKNVAKMIGGEQPTTAALENAKELVLG